MKNTHLIGIITLSMTVFAGTAFANDKTWNLATNKQDIVAPNNIDSNTIHRGWDLEANVQNIVAPNNVDSNTIRRGWDLATNKQDIVAPNASNSEEKLSKKETIKIKVKNTENRSTLLKQVEQQLLKRVPKLSKKQLKEAMIQVERKLKADNVDKVRNITIVIITDDFIIIITIG